MAVSSSICSAKNAENGSPPGAASITGAATAFTSRKLRRLGERTPGTFLGIDGTMSTRRWDGEGEEKEEADVTRVDCRVTAARAATGDAIWLMTADMILCLLTL